MKLFALFAALAVADKARPEKIDALKRVNKLKSFADECMLDDFFNRPGKQRIEKKLATFHRIATNYMEFSVEAQDAMNAEAADEETGGQRINRDDPCSCIGGIAGGYKSFFNRVQVEYPDIKGYKRNKAVKNAKNLVNNVLNGKFGCTLPNMEDEPP